MEWNAGIQGQITPSMTGEIQYVSTRDNHLHMEYTDNTPLPTKMGSGSVAGRGPYLGALGEFPYDTNIGYSNYNALQMKVEKRFSQGFNLLGSYTWSHCLDIDSGVYSESIPNPYNLAYNYGNCTFNVPQTLSVSYVYQLPLGRGLHFGKGWSGALNNVLGGWRSSGIVAARSGLPFQVATSSDIANTGTSSQRADQIGSPLPSGFTQTRLHWYDPTAFANPASFTFGNETRHNLGGPKSVNVDFALMKDFKFSEEKFFEFRAEAFNLFNHTNFSNPSATVGSPNLMVILGSASPRVAQLSLKFVF
jgi:hypothetical protein